MAALTKEALIGYGFDCNHPDYVLCKLHKHSTYGNEWKITVEQEYIPLSNDLAWSVFCYNTNEKGVIIKRAQVSYIKTIEELNSIIHFCNIDYCLDLKPAE